jgi:GNAT superfamily N-acetyltransferase
VFQRANDWAPVTNYLTPASLFPVDPNCIHHVPALIGVNLTLAGWHLPLPAQEFLDARSLAFRPTFKMDCSQDIERYWQQQGQLRAIKRSRKRCSSFKIEVNAPESLDWTIKNWHSKYKESRLGDRLLVARYLHDQGRMYTISAKDDEKLIAAEALLVYRDELIFQYNYRDPQYDWYGIGNRLLDHCFQWASEMGFKKLDLGGFSPEYKKRWAPQDGEIWVARICPELAHLKEVVRGWPRALRSLLGPTTNERASSK